MLFAASTPVQGDLCAIIIMIFSSLSLASLSKMSQCNLLSLYISLNRSKLVVHQNVKENLKMYFLIYANPSAKLS